MTAARIVHSIEIARTPRVLQLEGLFEIPPTPRSELVWDVDLPLAEHDWQIGLIVGPSGCGKTTIARRLFGPDVVTGFEWPQTRSIVDAFPARMGIKEITGLLSSVGFSSPPGWLRPFAALSTGEQFRVTLARALAESRELTVIDEFTSVVDRTVARIGSAAVARAVRQRRQKLIAVTCHHDVIDWLQPDWTYDPAGNQFQWRSLQPRPPITLRITRVTRDLWRLFQRHHYLNSGLHSAAKCFLASVEGRPAAFTAALSFPHPRRPGWREHRTVCLPDFQGVGIGQALSEFVASLFQATGKPYRSVTSHPALIHHRARSPLWRTMRFPSRVHEAHRGLKNLRARSAARRITASFEFCGPPRRQDAVAFGIL